MTAFAIDAIIARTRQPAQDAVRRHAVSTVPTTSSDLLRWVICRPASRIVRCRLRGARCSKQCLGAFQRPATGGASVFRDRNRRADTATHCAHRGHWSHHTVGDGVLTRGRDIGWPATSLPRQDLRTGRSRHQRRRSPTIRSAGTARWSRRPACGQWTISDSAVIRAVTGSEQAVTQHETQHSTDAC